MSGNIYHMQIMSIEALHRYVADLQSKLINLSRIWGAVRSCTISAVSSTLKKLTTVDNQLTVKRRRRFYDRSGISYYWFILRGNEDVLCELEGERDRAYLQTEWKLENCHNSGSRDDQQQRSIKQSTSNQNPNREFVS